MTRLPSCLNKIAGYGEPRYISVKIFAALTLPIHNEKQDRVELAFTWAPQDMESTHTIYSGKGKRLESSYSGREIPGPLYKFPVRCVATIIMFKFVVLHLLSGLFCCICRHIKPPGMDFTGTTLELGRIRTSSLACFLLTNMTSRNTSS